MLTLPAPPRLVQHLQVDDTAVVMAAIHLASVCLQAAVSPAAQARRPSTTSTTTTLAASAVGEGTPLLVTGPLPAAGLTAWPSLPPPPPALPAHSANTGFKRARNDPLTGGSAGHAFQQQQQQPQLPGGLRPWQWRATYTGLLSYATGHANPAVRCAAFDAVRKVGPACC